MNTLEISIKQTVHGGRSLAEKKCIEIIQRCCECVRKVLW